MFATSTRPCTIKNLNLFIRPQMKFRSYQSLSTNNFKQGYYISNPLLFSDGRPRQNQISVITAQILGVSTDTHTDIVKPVPKAWFKLLNSEDRWNRVPLTEVKIVADLKKVIKLEMSPKLDAYAASELILEATKIDKNPSEGVNLDEQKDLASILKDFQVKISNNGVLKDFEHNIQLFVYTPAVQKKKMETFTQLNTAKTPKEWYACDTFFSEHRAYYYYTDQEEQNQNLIKQILKGGFMQIYGPQASGRSTRVWKAMKQLASLGYECIYINFGDIVIHDETSFWASFYTAFGVESRLPVVINNLADFREAFNPTHKRWSHPVILFIDEFDKFFDTADETYSTAWSIIRTAEEDRNDNIIHSIVSIGTFATISLANTKPSLASFNAVQNFEDMPLTKEQVQYLYKKYSMEMNVTIEPEVIEDIYSLTGGHADLVCLCGRAIHYLLQPTPEKTLNLKTWQTFSITSLPMQTMGYPPLKKIIDTLTKEENRDAMDFIRLYFAADLKSHRLPLTTESKRLIEILTAQRVLQFNSSYQNHDFKMSSPFIEGLIRRHVIPTVYDNYPTSPAPFQNGELDMLNLLKETVKFFDKKLITSNITSKYVNNWYNITQKAPQESVYIQEMMRILVNWLGKQHCYTIAGHNYKDITIEKSTRPKIILEFMATEAPEKIKEYLEKSSEYQKHISADVSWVIHFTLEDCFKILTTWQSDEQLSMGVNLVHIWHNSDFTSARMNARWKDNYGTIRQIENVPLTI